MILSARMMKDVSGVNNFSYTPTAETVQGNQTDVFFQLVDAGVDLPTTGLNPPFRRFCPSSVATLQVTFKSIDNAVTVCRFASPAFLTQDTSVWKLTIFATDNLVGTYTMFLKLTDGSTITLGVCQMALQVLGLRQSVC
jgi:hypothetical protein